MSTTSLQLTTSYQLMSTGPCLVTPAVSNIGNEGVQMDSDIYDNVILEFTNEQEESFQLAITENPGCVSRRYVDKLVVLTGDDVPLTTVGDQDGN